MPLTGIGEKFLGIGGLEPPDDERVRKTYHKGYDTFDQEPDVYDITEWQSTYRTATHGPNGQELPEGAYGWNYYGDPDWGEGLAGWWNKTMNGWQPPTDEADYESPDWSRFWAGIDKDEGETFKSRTLENIGTVYQGISSSWNRGLKEPGVVGAVTKAGSVVGGGMLELLQVGERIIERGLGTAIGASEELGEPSGMPTFEEWSKNNVVGRVREALPQWTQGLSAISPIRTVYNSVRQIKSIPEYDFSKEEKSEIWRRNWDASRIAYSWIAEPAIKQEYLKLLASGEYDGKEYLAAQEVELPWVEMTARIGLDALNFLGFATKALAKGKLLKGVGRIARAADEVAPVVKNADEFIDAMRVAKPGQMAEGFTDFVKATKTGVDEIGTALDKAADSYHFLADTTHGKRFHATRRMYETAMHIAYHAPGDEQFEFLKALTKIASKSEDEIAEGLGIIGNYKAPRVLLGRNAVETGIYLRKMLMDEAGDINYKKFIDDFARHQAKIQAAEDAADVEKVGDAIEEFVNYVTNKSDNAIKEVFPTALDNQNATAIQRFFGKFHDTASKPYGIANSFFSSVYMGLSPGYAFRNWFTNSVGIFVDEGIGALFTPWRKALDGIKSWNVSPAGLETTFGGIHRGEGVAESIHKFESAWQAVKGTKSNRNIFQTFTRLSEWFEYKASVKVMNKAIDDTMRTLLRPGKMLPDTTRLAEMGLNQRYIDGFVDSIIFNKGNLKDAKKWLVDALDARMVNRFESGTWMTPELRKLRDTYFSDEDWAKFLKSSSVEEAQATLSRKQSEMFEATLKRLSQDASPGVKDAEFEIMEKAKGAFTPEDMALEYDRYHASRNAMDGGQDAIGSFVKSASDEISPSLAATDPTSRDLYNYLNYGVQQQFPDYFKGAESLKATTESQNALSKAWAWNNKVKGYDDIVDGKVVKIPGMDKGSDWGAEWRKFGLPGEPPPNLTKQYLMDEIWDSHTKPFRREMWKAARENEYEMAKEIVRHLEDTLAKPLQNSPKWIKYLEDLELSRRFDNAIYDRFGHKQDIRYLLESAVNRGKNDEAIRILANQYGIASISNAGSKYDSHIMHILSQYGIDTKRLQDVSLEDAMKAFEQRRLDKGWAPLLDEGLFDEGVDLGVELGRGADPTPIPAPMAEGSPVSHERALWESKHFVNKTFDDMAKAVEDNFGVMDDVTGQDGIFNAIDDWINGYIDDAGKYVHGAEEGVAESRAVASVTANNARAFTLHDYAAKKNFDLALSYLMPYHFWYNRTYMKWFTQRMWRNPEVFAAYAKYKTAMAKAHAGMPEWWRYNINTDELLGIDTGNPLFFNLEATMNPLNGLTGVDFNDPYKRVDWWTSTLDSVGKYGPSIWTPWSTALALSLYAKGEEDFQKEWEDRTVTGEEYKDAARRWAGRLIPQTAVFKSLTQGLKPGGIEADPFVHLFSGGMDPYEERRVQRALSALLQEDPTISEADLIDAGLNREGPLWEEAKTLAAKWRGSGQISSFIMGVGFKSRTQEDMQIDAFYRDYYALWGTERDKHPDEFRSLMEGLRDKYPFMDTLLISRKGGLARDRAFAYNVMSRIPPGMSNGIAEAVGIPPELLSRFYDEKGHIEEWAETDKDRFLVGIADIAAMLEVPDTATREEWLEARLEYGKMIKSAEKDWGEDIMKKVDAYYSLKGDDQISRDDADAFLIANPDVEEYLDWRAVYVMSKPLLDAYYGGLDTLTGFYKGRMYDQIDKELGDVGSKWREYWFLDATDDKAARKYYKENKKTFERYKEIRDRWQKLIDQSITDMAGKLPEGIPPTLREDVEETYGGQQLLGEIAVQIPDFTYAQWQEYLGESATNVLFASYHNEAQIPPEAYNFLESKAFALGITLEQMIEGIVNSDK